ncbi:MAG: 30S ribosomal protein S21 [Planctomycetes bacterium]|nr:30S ribosomal protein S21 [Planctomycetota bacterium]
MVKIAIRKGESFEHSLKRFKRICARAGIFSESKRIAYFEKPSDKKRRKEKARLATIRKSQSAANRGLS